MKGKRHEIIYIELILNCIALFPLYELWHFHPEFPDRCSMAGQCPMLLNAFFLEEDVEWSCAEAEAEAHALLKSGGL